MREDNDLSLSDLNDSTIIRENESLLSLLLKDHTTGKNIKWGTDSYINHGYSFRNDQEIKIDLITGWYEGFIRPRVDKDIDIQLERQRNRAEVFTPSWVIKLQVDAALKDMEELPLVDFIKTKWLEITCGEAPYMVNRYDMETGEVIPLKDRSGFIDVKFKKLNQEIEPEEEWLKLAVEIYKASYGYEYQGDSLLLARENLILTFIDNYFYMFGAFPKDKILLEITNIVGHNVFQMDGITYEVPYSDGGAEEFGTQLSLFESIEIEEVISPKLAKIQLWDKHEKIDFQELYERMDNKMKFDVVIGNPPYEDRNFGDNKTYAPPIYHNFMDAAYNIGKKVSLITPARFLFDAGSTPKSWNRKMLSDPHLKVLYYEQSSQNVFPNTDIKGGIAITYRDQKNEIGPIDTFTPYDEMKYVLNKIENNLNSMKMSDLYFSSGVYRLTGKIQNDFPNEPEALKRGDGYEAKTNIFEKLDFVFHEKKPSDNSEYFQMIGRLSNKRVYRWVKKDYIKLAKNHRSYKVIVPKSNGSGKFGETLSNPTVLAPEVGYTQTFISFGSFETENEALACLQYIKTKFFRALLSIKKPTQHNPITAFSKIPVQDFTLKSDIDWAKSIAEIDQQLYKKYNLTKKEINFIETHVKEME